MTTTKVKLAGGGTPPSGLAAAAVGSGGTFAAAAFFWVITFVNRYGETQASNEATATIVLNGSANLTWTAPPAGTTQVNVYRGTVTNTENKLVASLQPAGFPPVAPSAYTDTGTAGVAATPPAATAFTNLTLDTQGRTAGSDATLAGITNPGQLLQAIQNANAWHNAAGIGSVAALAAAGAAAVGVAIEDV